MGLSPSKSQPRAYPLVHPGYNVPRGQNPNLYLPPQLQNQISPPNNKKKKSKRSSQQERLAEAYVQGWNAGHNGMGPVQPAAQNIPPAATAAPPAPVRAASFPPLAGIQLRSFESLQAPPVAPTITTQRTPLTTNTFAPPQPEQPPVMPAQPLGQTQQTAQGVSTLAQVLQPLPPPNPSVYGPPPLQYPLPPLQNPLPPPPQDLYEISPYNTLLNLPQTTALLTSNYAQLGSVPPPSYGRRSGGRGGGLLRTLTGRGRKEEDVHFVPVFINAPGARTSGNPPQQQPAANVGGLAPEGDAAVPPLGPTPSPFNHTAPVPVSISATNARPGPQWYRATPRSGTQRPMATPGPVMPQPMAATPGPGLIQPIRFNGTTPLYSAFLNYSPHPILHNGLRYPTAMHLHEAMRFLPNNPEFAERIRTCPDVTQVYELSEELVQQYPESERNDWASAYIPLMEEAVLHKFRQNANLRDMLLKTGDAPLIYADEQDSFWGEGPPEQGGMNNLGMLLERVRDQLMNEGGLQI